MIPLLTSCVLKCGTRERGREKEREGEREGEGGGEELMRGLVTSLATNNIRLSFNESLIVVSMDAISLNFIVSHYCSLLPKKDNHLFLAK